MKEADEQKVRQVVEKTGLLEKLHGLLHLYSGITVLGLDWLLFSETLFSLGTALPIVIPSGFLVTGIATFLIQKKFGRDSNPAALAKAVFCGTAVAVPFPIFGTLLGAAIASISGLSAVMADPKGRLNDPPAENDARD